MADCGLSVLMLADNISSSGGCGSSTGDGGWQSAGNSTSFEYPGNATMTSPAQSTSASAKNFEMIRYVCEVYLTMPIAVAGIIGNMLSLLVLCSRDQRRRPAQASTAILGG